jgi:F0F1-type ATP synthase delta subunit
MAKIAKKLLNYAVKKAELIPVTADWEDVKKMYEEEKKFNRIVRELDRERRKK